MIATLKIDTKIRYRDVGAGPVLVFLHGYLESLKIWNGLVDELKNHFRIIAPDLPGQGQSEISADVQTMESMAEGIKLLLDNLKIKECYLIGHSMGGYVVLAFLEKYPEMVKGLTLFHSSPFADSEEKKQNRDREIELLRQGKKAQIYNTHVPKTFAQDNVEKFPKKIAKLKEIAQKTPYENIIAVLEGMKVRPDRSELLKNTGIPVQYIIGAKDNFIPLNMLEKLALPTNSETVIFENSGHMGMYEEKNKAIEVIKNFISKHNR